MRRLLATALLATIPLSAHSAPDMNAKAFTPRDLVMLDRVSDPRLSPDAQRVAYTQRSTDFEANKGVNQIWLLELAGGKPRALSSSGSNSSPRWSADGKSLYFLSTRSGSSQVWRLDLSGGEAQPVTQLPLDVNSFVLAPDGKGLTFAVDVFIDCKNDLACSKTRFDTQAASKASGRLYERLFIRHWDSWANGARSQLFTARFNADGRIGTPLWVSQDIDGDVPSKPFGDDGEYAYSPDAKNLVFAARIAGRTEAWSTNLDLYWVPADASKKPVNLTPANLATDTGPVFSPDGRYLAYRAMKRAGFESDRYAIMLRDLHSGALREVAPDWDRSAEGLQFSADGKTLYTHADDLGQHRVFAVDVASGAVKALTGDGHVGGFDVVANTLVYAYDTLNAPADLYALNLAAGEAPRRLSQANAERLKRIRFGEFEQFRFAGWNGETVYGHVMKPWNFEPGKKYPVALIVHGGPQGSMGNDWHYRWNPAVFAGMGYAVVFIDFHGSTGYGQAFTDSISRDWGGKPLEDLQKGWAHVLKSYDFIDGTRAAALGASYGGFMMNWIAGNWPDAFRCIVNHDGVFDSRMMYYATDELWFDEWEHGVPHYVDPSVYEKFNPANHVAQWKTPMLVIHSEKDYRVNVEQGIAAFTALQRRGIASQMLVFPDENHWVLKPQNSLQWHETVQAWLKRWIGN
ncbi:Dipeptidyl aminopeptidase/acylaminoacyl peptidase [Solimonas aquatica]|uniref:Dipeptidyl aminopeptidase/acylaminoacyl peptidase n=1 Tax=Solimonas aquatica TaxID=489703 RepID=A0A1H9HAQ9_9GAMM|nr:S9 family peptidase [Solimonas aquatica]SEQ59451.1 Dipeptidyl aminopeptidase/acylaminoacyl peptidase [Solimonas aquatica]